MPQVQITEGTNTSMAKAKCSYLIHAKQNHDTDCDLQMYTQKNIFSPSQNFY